MQDPVHALYQTRGYPAMSHPLSDPAVSSVAAMLGGLKTAHPSKARILEIGCCSGHNLIPLAMRWPDGDFTGIDLAEPSITEARGRAAECGVGNITFHAADLRDYKAEQGPFDFIIAHGFLSWVPDDVKTALFTFCRENLSPSGIATISFNLECGWAARFPVIRKTRAIQQIQGDDVVTALEILRQVTEPESPEVAIIDDMLAKGPAILAFDDFGPVNDPWPLDRFVRSAADAGLCWMGESDPAQNVPSVLVDEEVALIAERCDGPLQIQLALDIASNRTFRSGMLSRDDAPAQGRSASMNFPEFSIRAGNEPSGVLEKEIWRAIRSFAPACVPLHEVMAAFPEWDSQDFEGWISDGINRGWILPRIEPVRYEPVPPEFPRLNSFRLLCARAALPLVDEWHKPCAFPETHYQVLAAMDGSLRTDQLSDFSKTRCPELDFDPWLRHLASRGMFS